MRSRIQVKWLFPLVLCLIFPAYSGAQQADCSQIASLAKMARAISTSKLIFEKRRAGESYRAQVVSAARQFELDPKGKQAARLLLDLIPKDDAQKTAWITFGESLCDSEPIADMMALGRLG